MLGALFAILSAATFGFNGASARRALISSSVFQALSITIPMGVPLFLITAVIFGQWHAIFDFPPLSYLYLAVAGMIHFTWGRYCNYRAAKAMGANLTGPVQQFNMVVALVMAMIVLGETLTPLRIVGLILVIVGPAIMASGSHQKKAPKPTTAGDDAKPAKPAFEPKLLEGYTFALLSATGYGVSPVLVRLALERTHDVSFAAGFISYVAATLFFVLFLIPRGRVAQVLSMDRRSIPWFVNSGVFAFLAQMFRYLALSIAPVTVVTPIQRCAIVFRTLFSTLLNREHEVFNVRIVIGIVLALVGAFALALSMNIVARYVPLPAAVMQWHWP